MTPTVYVETSVISYYTARRSTNAEVALNQLYTAKWWEQKLPELEPVLSLEVMLEISAGDVETSTRRRFITKSWRILTTLPEVTALAEAYLKQLALPAKAKLDALHIAHASVHTVDY